jgi:type IV pilus assembly protein PilA
MSFSSLRSRRGFTLIELLLVIGIIAILASIVIVAINPTKQLGDARDAQRRSDVNTILNAVYQYSIDHNGTLPGNIPSTTALYICNSGLNVSCTNGVNLNALTGSYLVKVPHDPQASATGTGTRYSIIKDSNDRITVAAPDYEGTTAISVTR